MITQPQTYLFDKLTILINNVSILDESYSINYKPLTFEL